MWVLVVEDNDQLGQRLKACLASGGLTADVVGTKAEALWRMSEQQHDLYIVDLELPDGDGLDVVRSLRLGRGEGPILVTSEQSAIRDRIRGLDAGADDYLVKPYHHDELLARARALLRRPARLKSVHVSFGNLSIDFERNEVACNGVRFDMPPKERRLFTLLMRRPGTVVTRAIVEDALYADGDGATANATEKTVSRLRRVLMDQGASAEVRAVRGLGWRLDVAGLEVARGAGQRHGEPA